jgi:hypothetical protein
MSMFGKLRVNLAKIKAAIDKILADLIMVK